MSDYATVLSAYHDALIYIEELEALVPPASRSKVSRPEGMPPPKAAATAAAHPEGMPAPSGTETMAHAPAPATKK